MFCNYCGKENPDGSKFCVACGKALPVEFAKTKPLAAKPKSGSKVKIIIIICAAVLAVAGGIIGVTQYLKWKKGPAGRATETEIEDSLNELKKSGGVKITYKMEDGPLDESAVEKIIDGLQTHAEIYSEKALVYRQGAENVTVNLPGVSGSQGEELAEALKPKRLVFILYDDLKSEDGGGAPDSGAKVIYNEEDVKLDKTAVEDASVRTNRSEATGRDEYVVSVTFNDAGAKKFAEVTSEHIGEQLAIVYGDRLVSAPVIKSEISGGKCEISGSFEYYSAQDIAASIRVGAGVKLEAEDVSVY